MRLTKMKKKKKANLNVILECYFQFVKLTNKISVFQYVDNSTLEEIMEIILINSII